jgi:RNA polymerase sigma factor (sigma-70 family)
MADDSELLLRYCRDRSEAAFTELVGRYLNLVYFAALRQVRGDTHMAQDVSQAVFTRLALKASAISQRISIAGWLYNCTRFVAAGLMRGERRWQVRQTHAQAIMETNTDPYPMDWERLTPVIDEVLQGLSDRDRELVLLRYYRENSFVEISSKLGLSADAARFRLDRALGKMHSRLVRRGIESTSAALALALASQAQSTAPAGVAATIVEASLAAQASVVSVLPSTQILMSAIKIKVGILAAAAITGILLVQDLHREYQLHDLQLEFQSLQAENSRLAAQTLSSPKITTARLTGLLSQVTARQAHLAIAQSNSTPGLKPGMKAISSLTNVGQATPFASLETSIWANYTGNVDALAKMIAFLPDGKEAADKLWASLPTEIRTQFPTPESILAVLIAASFTSNNPVGYQVTGDRQNGPTPNDWLVQFQFQMGNGTTFDSAVAMRQINGNWMMLVGVEGIQHLSAHYLSGAGGAPSSN